MVTNSLTPDMNATSNYELTVVVPLYNEAENIARLEEKFREWLAKTSCRACVLFVNDGSTDGSLDRIVEVCRRNVHFFYLSFSRNAGLSAAIKAGIDFADSPLVGYMDADLQTTPEDFELLLPYMSTNELVTGIRSDRKDTAFHRMMTDDGATDTGCPLKLMKIENARRLPLFRGMHRFITALIMLQDGAQYKEVPVRHFPRTAGKSKNGVWNRYVAPIADCFVYRWMKRRAINYHVERSNI